MHGQRRAADAADISGPGGGQREAGAQAVGEVIVLGAGALLLVTLLGEGRARVGVGGAVDVGRVRVAFRPGGP